MGFLLFLKIVATFEPFTTQHYAPIVLTALIGIIAIRIGRKTTEYNQRLIGLGIGLIPFLSVATRMLYLAMIGEFTVTGDLPLHLCRLVALLAPFVMYFKWRMWLGIFYFWIFIGTLGANVLPELSEGFPSLQYFLFWLLHSVLVILPFYAIFVYKTRIVFGDLIRAYIATNLFLGLCWLLNLSIGSNYFYTMAKPNIGGHLDFLGEYPYYLLYGQLLIVILLVVLYLPYALSRFKSQQRY